MVLEWDPCVPNPCNNGGKCKSHLKEINELHLHEGALQSLIHGADESVVDVVEPEEESLGDNSFSMNHHPALYEEHDQATNSDVHVGQEHIRKHLPRFDSDTHIPWPSKSQFYHDDDDDDEHRWRLHGNKDNTEVYPGGRIGVHTDSLHSEVRPRIDGKRLDGHRDVSFEEANTIHGADSDGHPNEGEHPFTEHHPKPDNDIEEDFPTTSHHSRLRSDELHQDRASTHHDQAVIAGAANFKSHSGGVEEELASLHGKDERHDSHNKDIQKIDQDTVAEITKHVVDAVMKEKAKYSKRSSISRKNKTTKGRVGEKRKRTIHNLYVCECPPGFLGAHCQRKSP